MLQEAELALVEEKKDLETFYNKVYANKLLAEAMTQKQENSLEGMQQGMCLHVGVWDVRNIQLTQRR